MARVTINRSKIDAAAARAFDDAALIVHRNIVQVISEPGAFPGFAGDIVDTGNLRANQQLPQIRGDTAIFRNTADSAMVGSSRDGLGCRRVSSDRALMRHLLNYSNPNSHDQQISPTRKGRIGSE
jgi:hypothetical protein